MTTLSASRLSLHDIKRLVHGLPPKQKAMWLRTRTNLQWARRVIGTYPFATEVCSLTHPGLVYRVSECYVNGEKQYHCPCPAKGPCFHQALAQFEAMSPLSDRPWAGDVLASERQAAA